MNVVTICFRFLVVGLVVGFASCVFAQQTASLSATADREQVRIADPFTVTLKVIAPADARVEFPEFSDQFGPFEIVDRNEQFGVPEVANANIKTWKLTLLLETLETGSLDFPDVEVVVAESGLRKRIRSNPVTISVESSIEEGSDPTAFHDIRDVIDATIESEDNPSDFAWIWVGLVSGIAFATTAFVFAITRRRKMMSPGQWAKERLAKRDGLTLSNVESIYREFIADEFDQQTSCWTIEDFESFATEMQFSDQHSTSLQKFLFKVQQEKFAGLKVSDAEVNAAADVVVELIDDLQRENMEAK